MSVAEMCALAPLSRAGYYRFLTTPAAGDKDIDLRDAIQRIALESPNYGRPRITAELHRRGWQVGPNRVYRIMREAGSPLGAAMPPAAQVRDHDQLQPRPAGIPEPGMGDGADRDQSTLGGGHHLHPAGGGVR